MKITFMILGVVALMASVFALSTWFFQWIWNFVVPGLFHGPVLGFWQAAAVVVLLSLVGGMFKASSAK